MSNMDDAHEFELYLKRYRYDSIHLLDRWRRTAMRYEEPLVPCLEGDTCVFVPLVNDDRDEMLHAALLHVTLCSLATYTDLEDLVREYAGDTLHRLRKLRECDAGVAEIFALLRLRFCRALAIERMHAKE